MSSYTIQNEDVVKQTTERVALLSLKFMAQRLSQHKKTIEAWPEKTVPDMQTLVVYNEQARMMREPEIEAAKELLREFKEIYDAGQLPDKWVGPLLEFKKWLEEVK